MRFIPGSQLIRRSDSELSALFKAFHEALARAEPLSEDWKDAALAVDNIIAERKRRADLPVRRTF